MAMRGSESGDEDASAGGEVAVLYCARSPSMIQGSLKGMAPSITKAATPVIHAHHGCTLLLTTWLSIMAASSPPGVPGMR